jgi:sugar lactone lactonase YvrE
MKKLFVLTGILLVALVPLACEKTYTVGPLAVPISTSTVTSTPTITGKMVSTLAGQVGVIGSTNATGTAASFFDPLGVAVDSSGNVYVADSGNGMIRAITAGGVVSTLAGPSSFNNPAGVAVDASGNVYVGDTGNNLIQVIAPGGVVSTLAGSGAAGSTNATGTAASFNRPTGVAVDASGTVYVADSGNNLIRVIAPGGVVSTLAGSGAAGSTNATGTAASFSAPTGIAVDASGNVYVGDTGNNLIRTITPGGVVSTLAGSGSCAAVNGSGTAASFCAPQGVAVDTSGNIYVADGSNDLIREITPGGTVTTLAGTGSSGAVNGPVTAASFSNPWGIAVDHSGDIYVGDEGNMLIRKIQ